MLIAVLTAFCWLAWSATPEARRAFRMFENRALQGDAEAQYRLATILEKGWDSIPADSARALQLMRMSAQAGFPPAMNYMGYLYGTGYRVAGRELLAANADSARHWLEISARCDDPRAMSNLAYLLLNADTTGKKRDEIDRDRAQAIRYLQRASDMGAPTAMSMLGDLYRDGRGVECDTAHAAMLYDKAMAAGLEDAEPRLITMMAGKWRQLSKQRQLESGLKYYTTYAPAAGTVLLEMAAELPPVPATAGDSTLRALSDSAIIRSTADGVECSARALTLLGEAAGRGLGLHYDHDRSVEYYVRGALAGNPSAMFTLAEMLEMFPDAVMETSAKISDFADELGKLQQYTGMDLPTADEIQDPRALMARAKKAGITDARRANNALYNQSSGSESEPD